MSMRYEGAGLLLDTNRILRALLSREYYEKRTPFFITAESVIHEKWRDFDLTSSWDNERKGWLITVTDRTNPYGPWKIPLKSDEVDEPLEGEYEIITEPAPLPSPPKLLPRVNKDL